MSDAARPAMSQDELIRDFMNPALNLVSIAEKHAIAICDLVRLVSTAEFRAQLAEILRVIQDRAQFLAAAAIETVVESQKRAIVECLEVATAAPQDLADPKALKFRARLREQSRKASNLVFRIARPPMRNQPKSAAEVPAGQHAQSGDRPIAPLALERPSPGSEITSGQALQSAA